MAKLASDGTDHLIGKRIQMRRKEVGLTAQELSELIDISQQQLSRYERGTNKINVSHLVRLSIALKTPISWFFIDCFPEDFTPQTNPSNFVPVKDSDLKSRFDFVWNKLSSRQRQALISFMDDVL
ncbi:helix-turn-helix domain-containing protein [Kluyvera cryocrescens]|uniref:helix-turn-helix domain-containing protein n=1 Tax=Kluyvera cryocrescens TaxID=580 RepID=UPI002DB5AAAC|nr:helix-turn-helix transcriptional regulator [Kluyvera cryocrescens]MEB7712781.1 helix-turn-helix domain-containing protein [Kluyvera cryocrescens]